MTYCSSYAHCFDSGCSTFIGLSEQIAQGCGLIVDNWEILCLYILRPEKPAGFSRHLLTGRFLKDAKYNLFDFSTPI